MAHFLVAQFASLCSHSQTDLCRRGTNSYIGEGSAQILPVSLQSYFAASSRYTIARSYQASNLEAGQSISVDLPQNVSQLKVH